MTRKIARTILSCLLIFSLLLTQFASVFVPSVYAASSPWSQIDWSGGSGQTSLVGHNTKFDSSSTVTTSTAGQVTLIN